MSDWLRIGLVGIGATVIVDLWSVLRRLLFGVPMPDFGLVGRWLAYLPRGRFRHDPIGRTTAVAGERGIGWIAHYLIGIAFSALLAALAGVAWTRDPTVGPAMAVGLGTVVFPFLVMQPGMGAGIAASRTPNPTAAQTQSLLTHAVFGLGLYLTAQALRLLGFSPS
jgi:DUF2938 family protein